MMKLHPRPDAVAVSIPTDGQIGDDAAVTGVAKKEIEAEIPLGQIPPQDDIAHSVVFFASPWSRVITGQTLDVNGGEFLG